MPSIFKTVSWSVDHLIGGVSSGMTQLPDLQRPFVWPATKVRDLLDSMYKGYPVGALMFWDVPADGQTRAIAQGAKLTASHQIVDGQQRLTSLYASTQGLKVRNESYQDKAVTISFNPFTERFEVRTPFLACSVQGVAEIATFFQSPLKAKKAFFKRLEAAGQTLTDEEEEQLDGVLTRLTELKNYLFDVVHIDRDAEKRTVADIFVRINSEGARLKASDYILTWLSVFWPQGREAIEEFARNSRMTPDTASALYGHPVAWTPKNPFLAVETSHVVRALVAYGQRRGRLQDAYAALQAKDRATGMVDSVKQEAELQLLKDALPVVLDRVSWTEFIHSIQMAGFRNHANITSNLNLVYSYVLFLIGRHTYRVDLPVLRRLIARWLFMSQLTARYTGSSESQIQKDLDRLDGLDQGDAAAFERVLDAIITSQLTSDYWRYALPQNLITSGAAVSPHYQCYLAALNILNADMFMIDMKVHDWMDPSLPTVKGVEGHHLFPRNYLETQLGLNDIKTVNQVANFAPTDWDTNIEISDDAPSVYWPHLVSSRKLDADALRRQQYWHALPDGWAFMSYDAFLAARRALMSNVTRDAFDKLSGGTFVPGLETVILPDAAPEPTLAELFEAGALRAGDLLDPVDPEHAVDAVVTDDGTIRIDDAMDFDSFDAAARHLGVTNITGFEFWGLERDGEVVPLGALA